MQPITAKERNHLRELARRYLEYANLPIMAERTKRWYAHNGLRGGQPMVVMETGTFADDLMPPLACAGPLARHLEWQLTAAIVNHELVDDDKVISPHVVVPWHINYRMFDLDAQRRAAADYKGRTLGFEIAPAITDLARDLPKLRRSTFSVDRAKTLAWRDTAADALGDLLDVRIENHALTWFAMPTYRAGHLLSDEGLFLAMATQPDLVRALYDFIRDDIISCLDWQEREGLLTLNNGNHYAGAGSYGFTDELPAPASESARGGAVRLTDLWMNMNSQETTAISPGMFADLVYPTYDVLARKGGLVYFGCCEPVHAIWERCISRLPNLRKVSVSAWCDEARMGEALAGGRVIYSRKPSPNFVGVGAFDPAAYSEHIAATLNAARGCQLEIICRDIYTLCGDRTRAGQAVQVIRRQIDKLWA